MKTKSFIFLFFLTTLSLFSQEEKKVVFGVKAGVNMSDNRTFVDNYSMGYQIGTFTEIGLANNQSIIPEILYSSLRSKSILLKGDCGNETETEEMKTKESHLFFDILYKYYFTKKFTIVIGPRIDYFFERKFYISKESFHFLYPDNPYNTLFLGVVGGVGYTIKPNTELSINYSANFNMSDYRYYSLSKNILMLSVNYSFK